MESINLSIFFVALLGLLFAAQALGLLFEKLAMPKVVGEICGGLLLGPTFFGQLWPNAYIQIFQKNIDSLTIIYWLGLVLLMFCSGFEIDRKLDKQDVKIVSALVLGTTLIPFACGWIATNFFDIHQIIGYQNNILALRIVIAVGIAVTSIPVISKIFFDLGIIKTNFARIVLATATMHDIILWIFVSIATGLVSAKHLNLPEIILRAFISFAFFGVALFVTPKIIAGIKSSKIRIIPANYELSFIILILLFFTVTAALLDVNLVFGAFLAGIVVNFTGSQKFDVAKSHIKNFSFSFFVPIYFAMVGFKLDLLHHFNPGFFGGFFLFAIVVQSAAVFVTTYFLEYGWLSSCNLAVALNDRGGPCIVMATLAYDLGIINQNFFVILILLAIATSLIAGVWFKFVLDRKWPLLDCS